MIRRLPSGRKLLLLYLALLAVSHLCKPFRSPTRPLAPEQHRTTLGEFELAYRDLPADRPEAPVLVFIHSCPWKPSAWEDLLPELRGRYRLIVPDLPGFGASTTKVDGYSIETQAKNVLELLDHLEVREGRPARRRARRGRRPQRLRRRTGAGRITDTHLDPRRPRARTARRLHPQPCSPWRPTLLCMVVLRGHAQLRPVRPGSLQPLLRPKLLRDGPAPAAQHPTHRRCPDAHHPRRAEPPRPTRDGQGTCAPGTAQPDRVPSRCRPGSSWPSTRGSSPRH